MTQIPLELWIAATSFALALGMLWLLLTEGSYLGSGWVRKSYDWLAPWYEGKWKADEYQSTEINRRLFLDPILNVAGDNRDSRVLDLACGTGRVSCLLLEESRFLGMLKALDFSSGMLQQFRKHLDGLIRSQQDRAELVQQDLSDWRCESPGSFDAILFLEAAELVPKLPNLLSEIHKALKPGGVLITTRVGPKFIWLFPGRHQTGESMNQLLIANGFNISATHAWRKRYDVIIAGRS